VEGDLAVGHGADVGAGVGGDEGGLVGVGEAEEPVQAVHLRGQADGAGVLHQGERQGLVVGWVVVFKQHVAGVVDVDLRAVFLDAVARDAAQRVADVEALAVDDCEDGQDEDDEDDEFFHRGSGSDWFGVRKVGMVSTILRPSGSFDSGSRDDTARAFAQDDGELW